MRNKFTTTAQAQPAGSNEMAAWLTGYFSSLLLAKTWSVYKGVWGGGDGGGLVLMAAMVWGGIRFRCLLFLSIL